VPQAVGVVAVLVAGGNHQHPEAQDPGDAMHDTPRRARIGHAGGQAVGDAEAAFDLAQRQHAGIRGELATVDADNDRLAADR
jgi:general stress protein YciG